MVDNDNMFRYFAPDPPAVIPEGTIMELQFKTALELMAERDAKRENDKNKRLEFISFVSSLRNHEIDLEVREEILKKFMELKL